MSAEHSIRQLAVVAVAVTITTFSSIVIMAQRATQDRVLASEQLPDGATLTLFARDVGPPSGAAQLRYALSTKPAAGARTDTVFYLSYLPPGSTVASTGWITYRAVHVAAPWPEFAAALIRDSKDHSFLIFVESNVFDICLSIYRIDPARLLAGSPPELNQERREDWPPPSLSLSSLSYKLSTQEQFDYCHVSAVSADWKDDTVTVQAQRELPHCDELRTSFNLKTAIWADVQRVKKDESR